MGTSDAALLERPDSTAGPSDHQLVSAVRRGDERAFETLYARYQRRITAYVHGMVKDHGRAEDITQEVFVSALRRMRQTERPIAFKPWIYEIAKNACIDAYRRGRRAEEVSFDADDRLSPSDYGRLVATGPGPDAAVDAKQDLDHLRGAFGGLSDTHHQILVLRELEGRSYKDIGERMGMSRPAVESTLFRARKRLGEEYDELASGARCLRIQTIIADSGGRGLRDKRRLARHVSHCQPCRRLAGQAGLDVAVPVRTRVAGKLAALLPLPAFLRLRRGGGDAVTAAGGSGGGHGWVAQLPSLAEPLQSGWGKAAAGLAALLVAGAGAGVTTSLQNDKRDARGAGAKPAAERPVASPAIAAPARKPIAAPAADDRGKARVKGTVTSRGERRRAGGARGKESLGANTPRGDRAQPGPSAGGRDDAPAASAPEPRADDARRGGSDKGGGDGAPAPPKADPGGAAQSPDLPAAAGGAGERIQEAANNVDQTVRNAGGNVDQTVQNALQNTQQLLNEPQNLVPNVGNTVNDALNDVGNTANDAVNDLTNTVGGLLRPR
jgi:RNA polymerase sigma factor (sigma-70 family)